MCLACIFGPQATGYVTDGSEMHTVIPEHEAIVIPRWAVTAALALIMGALLLGFTIGSITY